MSDKSFQHEKPPARINIVLDQKTAGQMKKDKLDFRMLVTGQFTGEESDEPLEDIDVIKGINQHNFDQIMKDRDLKLSYTVPNKISGDGDLGVNLDIEGLDSFSPDQVAAQVPALQRLLAARKLMGDLKNRLLTVPKFRRQLESVLQDDAKLKDLLDQIQDIVPDQEEDES